MKKYYLAGLFVLFAVGFYLIAARYLAEDAGAKLAAGLDRLRGTTRVTGHIHIETFASSSVSSANSAASQLVPVSIDAKGGLAIPAPGMFTGTADGTVTFGSGSEAQAIPFSWRLDSREISYLKFHNLPAMDGSKISMTRLNDVWLSLGREDLVALASGKALDQVPATAAAADNNASLGRLLSDRSYLAIAKRLTNDIIDGTPTRHYLLRFDNAKLAALLEPVTAPFNGLPSAATNSQALASALDHQVSLDSEVWVDARTSQIRQLGVEVQPLVSNMPHLPIRVLLTIDDDQQAPPVDIPVGAVSVEQALRTLIFSPS